MTTPGKVVKELYTGKGKGKGKITQLPPLGIR